MGWCLVLVENSRFLDEVALFCYFPRVGGFTTGLHPHQRLAVSRLQRAQRGASAGRAPPRVPARWALGRKREYVNKPQLVLPGRVNGPSIYHGRGAKHVKIVYLFVDSLSFLYSPAFCLLILL